MRRHRSGLAIARPAPQGQFEVLYAKVRAGKDPAIDKLHITKQEFVNELNRAVLKARIEELENITQRWELSPATLTMLKSYLEARVSALKGGGQE